MKQKTGKKQPGLSPTLTGWLLQSLINFKFLRK